MSRLAELIERLEKQNEKVGIARNAYLAKDAEKKTFEARLIRDADGKSHAEKTVLAQATEDWLSFQKDLARLEAVFEFEKFKLEILEKEWLAEYASLKSDERQLKRSV